MQVEVNGDDTEAVRERLLDSVPLEIQEAWICEDIMFVLQVSCVRIASQLTSLGD
jgi:hypothetical protein